LIELALNAYAINTLATLRYYPLSDPKNIILSELSRSDHSCGKQFTSPYLGTVLVWRTFCHQFNEGAQSCKIQSPSDIFGFHSKTFSGLLAFHPLYYTISSPIIFPKSTLVPRPEGPALSVGSGDSSPSSIMSNAKASFSGSKTAIPDYDVSRLSFYLKCCAMGCGLDLGIHPVLLDYVRAHLLPIHGQEYIFHLALRKYSPEALVNRAYFIDDHNVVLPAPLSNAFYEVDAVAGSFPVQRQLTLAGETIPLVKVMLCTSTWINEIYIRSIWSLQQVLANSVLATPFNHSSCLATVSPSMDFVATSLHCGHCRGMASHFCMCEHGCPALHSATTTCQVLHFGCLCRNCGESQIRGPRYQCLVCDNGHSLCQHCYENGEHDQTHSFVRIERMGASPVRLCAQVRLICDDSQDAPMAIAVPIDY
jgi:hypothetical protein